MPKSTAEASEPDQIGVTTKFSTQNGWKARGAGAPVGAGAAGGEPVAAVAAKDGAMPETERW
ncbi:MAG: hypothetical protein ACR2JY_23140 [Chloroflexota bacterium]